jgi:hypothetical protein
MLGSMANDLFAIFPDLPSGRPTRPLLNQLMKTVEYPPSTLKARPPTIDIARRRLPADNREATMHVALRRISRIAQAECERGTRDDRRSRVLCTILAIAKGATRTSPKREPLD